MEAVSSPYDLAVLGGGPAGCAAAITAARSGARVLLLERGRFPRHKVCGEFVSAESLGALAELLADCPESAGLVQSAPRVTTARLLVDGHVLSTPVDPPAASITRYQLDHCLWSAAQRAGVDARQQCGVAAIAGTCPFTISTATDSFTAWAVINASGRWSNLNANQDVQPTAGAKWIGVKAHFREPNPSCSVDLYFFGSGYCGVEPVQTGPEQIVNVCAMVRSDVATCLADVLQQHPALCERSRNWVQVTEQVSTAPLVFRSPEPTIGNILFAGDAAGFVDPFVGDGISLALRSGRLAADSLMPFRQGRVGLADAVAVYREKYNHDLVPVFRTSSKIRRLLALPYAARVPLILLFSAAPSLTRYLVRKTR